MVSSYLLDLLTKYQSGRTLISVTLNLLKIPRSKLNQREDCAFAVAAQNSGIACLIISGPLLPYMNLNHSLKLTCFLWFLTIDWLFYVSYCGVMYVILQML